jgi:hypothetical protein
VEPVPPDPEPLPPLEPEPPDFELVPLAVLSALLRADSAVARCCSSVAMPFSADSNWVTACWQVVGAGPLVPLPPGGVVAEVVTLVSRADMVADGVTEAVVVGLGVAE